MTIHDNITVDDLGMLFAGQDKSKPFCIDLSECNLLSAESAAYIKRRYAEGYHFYMRRAALEMIDTFSDSPISISNRPVEYSLEGAQEFGGGLMSKTYNAADGRTMIKVCLIKSLEGVEEEFRCAQSVKKIGISTPAVKYIIKCCNQYGLLYERVVNKISMMRMLSRNPEKVEEYAHTFARLSKELHSKDCDVAVFTNIKDRIRDFVSSYDFITEKERNDVLAFASSLPDCTKCAHGDLHPGNILFDGEKYYFIDLGGFNYGCPELDFGIMIFFVYLGVSKEAFEVEPPVLEKFLRIWVMDEYGLSKGEVDAKIRELGRYATLHMLVELKMQSDKPEPFSLPGRSS